MVNQNCMFNKPHGQERISFVLLHESDDETKPGIIGPPDCIMMMEDGGVVTMGGSPFIVYYANWAMVSFFTGAKLSSYTAEAPEKIDGLPAKWDTGSTMMGPMG